MSQLRNRSILVFGISADTVAQHRAFAQAESLNFALLADPQKAVIRAYGVLGASGLPERTTFIVGPDGAVHGIDRTVNAQFSGQGATLVSHHGENLALLLSDWKAAPGTTIPNLFLPDADGKTVSPFAEGQRASVLVFLSARCRFSAPAAEGLRALAASPIYRNVGLFGVVPGRVETPQELKAFAAAHGLTFALGRDLHNEVTDHFAPTQTPTVWVLDSRHRVVYRGAMFGAARNSGSGINYVREALDATLMGRAVPLTEATGPGTPLLQPR